ncbi:MAG: NAD(P)-dependent oxidoreductase [bacterium]
MKVLVNGATGLVGLSVIDALQESNQDVRASDRPGSDFSEVDLREVEVVPADLSDAEALGKAVQGMDAVVHVAGLFDLSASPGLLDEVNHQGTRNMCEAVLKYAPNLERFVHVATVGVYGKPVRCPCREDDPKRPRNHYEKTKYLGELSAFEYHHKHGLPVASIRPTLIYGPRSRYGHAMFIAAMSLLKEGLGRPRLISLRSGPYTSHVHIDDVGRAARLVAQSDGTVGKAFNVADPNPLAGPAFVRALADPLGLEVKPWIPYSGPVASSFGALLPVLPDAPFRWLNNFLEKRWEALKESHGLADGLRLRLDPEWIGYMTGDNYYDVSGLKKLGMEWKWPDAVEGLKSTIEWYKKERWIP